MSKQEIHYGRLIDHVHLVVKDIRASKTFYGAVLKALGHGFGREGEHFFEVDELFVSDEAYFDGKKDSTAPHRIHLAFQAPDHETVRRFYQAAVAAGGAPNGEPGERDYHPGYFGAFVLDPDGNNIEAICHGQTQRSAESVVSSYDA